MSLSVVIVFKFVLLSFLWPGRGPVTQLLAGSTFEVSWFMGYAHPVSISLITVRTVFYQREALGLSSAVPAIWNNLPTSVTEANSLPAFRRRLKTHLFTVAFENSG